MNGPEHYREAERLLTEHERIVANHAQARAAAVLEAANLLLAKAQAHATLALAAATAEGALNGAPDPDCRDACCAVPSAWVEAIR